jgi:uncharacterized protein YggE
MNRTRILLAAAAGAALLALGAVAWPQGAVSAADDAEEGITVTAVGSVDAVPDRATFSFGVTTDGATAKQASTTNAARMKRLIDALKGAGIRAEDIRTENVSVSRRHSPTGETLPGYTAENSVSVRVASPRAGAIVDLAVESGATTTSGPSFDVSDREALYRNALRAAVEEARKKAEAIATAGGISVGDVTRVVEGGGAGPPVYLEAAATRAAATPIEPGQEKVQATLTVTFAVG